MVRQSKQLCSHDCHLRATTSSHVVEIGSLDSTVTHRRLVARILAILVLMAPGRAVHPRKARLSGYASIGYVPPNNDAKMGGPLVEFLLKAALGVWSFGSLILEALPRDAWR